MSTRNRLNLQTLVSQPVMLKNLPDHWVDALVRRWPSLAPIFQVLQLSVD